MLNNITSKIFITVFILIALHAGSDGPQSNRYTDATQSLVDSGSFALKNGYRSHVDVVLINHNFYSVIPPGIPVILAPLYFIHRSLMGLIGIPIGSEVYWAIFNLLTNIFVMAPLVGVVAVIMFKTLSKFTDDVSKKLWLVFIFIFGSLVFFYSTYGIWVNVYTMSFIFIAFYFIINKKNPFLIGLLLGLAQFFDYIAIVPICLMVGFWIYINIKANLKIFLKQLLLLLLGYSVFLGLLMYYNYIITGSVFQTPNSLFLQQLNQQQPGHKSMYSMPSFQSLFGLTVSPFRGIFLYFPMTFLFAIAFIKKTFRRNHVMLFSFIVVAFIFLINSTYYAWSGDVCFGPRHLVLATPFIILPIVYCPMKLIKLLGALSVFINLAGVSTVPSNNLFTNIIIFLYRGPSLHWLDSVYQVILPQYYNIHISLMTPFFIYVATGLLIYVIWQPSFKHNTRES